MAGNETTNVQYRVEGDTLLIEVDLSQRHGPTSSKKGLKIATTNWGLDVAETAEGHPIVLSLNVYQKGGVPAVEETPAKASGKKRQATRV